MAAFGWLGAPPDPSPNEFCHATFRAKMLHPVYNIYIEPNVKYLTAEIKKFRFSGNFLFAGLLGLCGASRKRSGISFA